MILCPLNTLNKTGLIDAKWLGKKLVFWRESRRVDKSLIIVCKSIKEIENLIFQCKMEFYFTREHQNLYFHSWLPPLVKTLYFVFIRWNKIPSYTEKIKYPLFIELVFRFIELLCRFIELSRFIELLLRFIEILLRYIELLENICNCK